MTDHTESIDRTSGPVLNALEKEWTTLLGREQKVSLLGRAIAAAVFLVYAALSPHPGLLLVALAVMILWWLDRGATALRREQVAQAIDEFSSIEALRVIERSNGEIFGAEIRKPELRLRRRLLSGEPLLWSLPLIALFLYSWLHVPLEARAAAFVEDLAQHRGQVLPENEVRTLTEITTELRNETVAHSAPLGKLFLAIHQLKIRVSPFPDFSGADIGGANLSHGSYEGVILERANLAQSRAINSDMDRAELTGADLRGADWSKASLVGAFSREINAEGSTWDYANLAEADFSLALLNGASFRNAILRDVDFGGADLRRADLRGADLRGAKLKEAMLDNALLEGALIEDTILTGMTDDTRHQASIGPGR